MAAAFFVYKEDMKPLVAVVGPTASGKTALGEALAKKFHGEIVSADAKQVYRGMDIGTAKALELSVPQHLIDIKNPGEKITVAEYQQLAYEAIDTMHAEGKQPFLVGGSMLYIQAVLEGYAFGKENRPRYRALTLGIAWEREALQARAKERLQERFDAGLLEEVEQLLKQGVDVDWLIRCGIEYRYCTLYLQGELSLEDAKRRIEIATNQYIKRQYTWWRHHGNVRWIAGEDEAVALVEAFLQSPDVVY